MDNSKFVSTSRFVSVIFNCDGAMHCRRHSTMLLSLTLSTSLLTHMSLTLSSPAVIDAVIGTVKDTAIFYCQHTHINIFIFIGYVNSTVSKTGIDTVVNCIFSTVTYSVYNNSTDTVINNYSKKITLSSRLPLHCYYRRDHHGYWHCLVNCHMNCCYY